MMVVPLLPSSAPANARANAGGRAAAAAGDFAADLDALLAATNGAAAGLAAMLGLASPAGVTAQALPPDGTMPPGATLAGAPSTGAMFAGAHSAAPTAGGASPEATPHGASATTQILLPPGALAAGALAAGALSAPAIPDGSTPHGPPTPTVPTPLSPAGGNAEPASGLHPEPNPRLQADPTAIAATAGAIGEPAAAAQEPWATSPSPTGEAAAPSSAPRPGAGEAPRPPSPASTTPGPDRSEPVLVDGPPATARTVEPQGSSLPPSPASVAAPIAQVSGHRAPERPASAEAAPLPAIPVRIAELTRRRTGMAEQIVVRLDPPELGTVRITVTARGDNVHVTLRADNPEARAALAAQRDSIETLLSGEGFDLSSFDVGYQRQGNSQPDTRPRANGARFSAAFDPAEPAAPTTVAADGAIRL